MVLSTAHKKIHDGTTATEEKQSGVQGGEPGLELRGGGGSASVWG